MTTINLTSDTIRKYLGGEHFRGCQEIKEIYCKDVPNNLVNVIATIPASTTRQGSYNISVHVTRSGSGLYAICTCPIEHNCKHIEKVLLRIRESRHIPIPGPSKKVLEREAKAQRISEKLNHASVYLAIVCKSELDSGSDYRRSKYVKDNVDQETLGVFFSKRAANKCALEHVKNEYEDDDDNEEDDDDEEEDDDDEEEDDDDNMGVKSECTITMVQITETMIMRTCSRKFGLSVEQLATPLVIFTSRYMDDMKLHLQ